MSGSDPINGGTSAPLPTDGQNMDAAIAAAKNQLISSMLTDELLLDEMLMEGWINDLGPKL